MKTKVKKVVIVVGMISMALIGSLTSSITSYAAGSSETHATEFVQAVTNTYKQDSVKALGSWEQQSDDSWVFKQHGGTLLTNSWIESLTEKGAYYFVGADGRMVINELVADGRATDTDGLWREPKSDVMSTQESSGNKSKEMPNKNDYSSSNAYNADLLEWMLNSDEFKAKDPNMGYADTTLN